jgi:N-acetylglucosaminyldiphosphoundecaprenol N-acetyl-beta-D-mannosaminyltransferase
LRRIRESGASVLLVAYGAPGQVHWIARNQDALAEAGVRLVAGIGGAIDFVSGTVPRAPGVVRRLGLEWAYRLVREPWRWRRQLVLPVFGLLVLRDVVRRRLKRANDRTLVA